MKIKRAGAIPLVTHDPYFSIWSDSDNLNDKNTVHWCGREQRLGGYVRIDGIRYCFLGDKWYHAVIPQISVDVTATATEYVFENDKIILKVRFTSPLVLSDMLLVSRPCTYVDFEVERKAPCNIELNFEVFGELVTQCETKIIGDARKRPAKENMPEFSYAYMGRARQLPLGGSGDMVTIDWGYAYLASAMERARLTYDHVKSKLHCLIPVAENESCASLIIAYDDLLSINYFGQWRKAYWTKYYTTILDAIGASFADKCEVLDKANKLDEDIHTKAMEYGGEAYAYLCHMSYRQTISAHKLIVDEDGEIIFLSKENNSNGCIGTVDVSYPSVPLFLLYDTEYVKGMLRPIFKFADCDVWEEDYAPHDVGRYPYAWGQWYGVKRESVGIHVDTAENSVLPPYYLFPAGSNIYDFASQMPVEECANMLIMTAAVSVLDGNTEFAEPYMETLSKWVQYLITYGADPGDQLCTDDFAKHLAHNVNLSAKAIVGIEAYSILLGMQENEEGWKKYHQLAKEMAADWEKRAGTDDHYMLAFGNPESWSLKYNLVWDKVFGSELFSEEVYEKELAWYVNKLNRYGTPLDNRKERSKTDWILWCVAMGEDREQGLQLLKPVADYLEQTPNRVAFCDKYNTETGEREGFAARSVQGGIFMPILREEFPRI